MTDVKALLDAATPLPWLIPPGDDSADTALIVHAVNRLPDYEAAVDALKTMLGMHTVQQEQEARAVLLRLRGEA